MEQLDEQSKLRKYILNDISDKERSLIEERLLTDDEYFEEVSMAEENLIQDYADGNLDAKERERFEKSFLSSEENRQKVKFARALRKYVNESENSPQTEKKPGFFNSLKAFFSAPVPIAVAVLVIVGVTGFFVWNSFSKESEVLVALNKSQKNSRPTEARITGFDYAPKIEGTRGTNKNENLDLALAKSRAIEAVLKNETAENLHELGRVYLAEGNFDEAIKQFEKALKKNPNIAKLHNDLGVALMEKGKQKEEGRLEFFPKANEEIEKALELDETLTEAYFNRALVIESLNLPNQAKEAWRKYLKIDSSSQWANEAREHLQKLETTQPISKTRDEIRQDFLEAKRNNDNEKAWQTLSRNREMITGKLIPQQLAFSFVDAKTNGNEIKAKEFLDALVYAGKLEAENSGDLFWQDIAKFYSTVSNEKISLLKQAHDNLSEGYTLCQRSKYGSALENFYKSREMFSLAKSFEETKISEYWISYCEYHLSHITESNNLLVILSKYAKSKNYKWFHAQTLLRKVNNYQGLREYSKAIEAAQSSVEIARMISDDYTEKKALLQLADNYCQIQNPQATLKSLEKVFDLQKVSETGLRERWRVLFFSVQIFLALNHYTTSIFFGREAILAAEQLEDSTLIHASYIYLSKIFSSIGKLDEALKAADKSLQIAENESDEEIRKKSLSWTNLQLGKISYKTGKYDEALNYFEKILQTDNKLEFDIDIYEAKKNKLLCLIKLDDYSGFQNELLQILGLFEKNRHEIFEEENRNKFFEAEQNIYDYAIDYEFSKQNYEKAFNYSELSRSRSLLNLMEQNAIPLKIEELRPNLADDIQIVEYSVLSDKVLIWLISKTDFAVYKVDISAEVLKTKISSYIEVTGDPSGKNFEDKSKELYSILIAPFASKLDKNKKLCFIADKFLFRLAFNSLISPATENYLITDFATVLSPSLNVFQISTGKANKTSNKESERILSVGNPNFDDIFFKNLEKLTSAANEAQIVSSFYQNKDILVGKDASKEKLEKLLTNANVLHFAGHYIAENNIQDYSGMILAGKDTLTSSELSKKKFNNLGLVVLSACDSGIERYYEGEGMIGMARTFLSIGVPNIIGSQWKVDSEATAELMTNFHHFRKQENLSTIEALRHSQLQMLNGENQRFRHPYFWSSFILIGGNTAF